MDTGLYSGVAAMQASERRLDAIAANLANVGTMGYKRQTSVTHAFQFERAGGKHEQMKVEHAIDFTPGEIEHTGNPFDLAIDGPGFFAVDSPQGTSYTRNGRLHVDERGLLLTQDNLPVQWVGARGTVRPIDEAVTVDDRGEVRQGTSTIGRLRVVTFTDPRVLTQDSHGYFVAPRAEIPQPTDSVVHQGALERSNVSSIDELVALITAQRGFESASTVMRSIDQSYKRLNQAR